MPAPLIVNELDLQDIMRSRLGLLTGGLDAKRPRAWEQFGWPESLGFADYFKAYERGGAAFGAVHRLLDKCWTERPRFKRPEGDDVTPWEQTLIDLLDSVNAWPKLRDWDRRNMVGRYSGLILRVADGRKLAEPLGAGKLRDIVPVFEDQLRVTAWISDTESEDFGKPAQWQYRMRTIQTGDQQGRPDQWVDVHPSRVVILAEGAPGGDFFDGVPLLRAGFNELVNLEKVSGGSAEGFLKNSSRHVVFKFDAQASPQAITTGADGKPTGKTVRQVVGEQTAELNTGIESAIATQGADVSVLQTTMHDPKPSFEVAANLFAASVQIPFTILFGQQTGRLASDQDQKDWSARCRSRQVNELTPALRELVTRLQACGAIEAGDFVVEWAPLDAPGEKDKAELLSKLAAAMKAFFDATGEPLFTRDELRAIMDYEEAEEGDFPDPMEGEPDADDMPPARTPAPAPGPAPQPAANTGGGLVQRAVRSLLGAANADERTVVPIQNPEADQTMRLARQYLGEGRTVELSLRVEAAPAVPIVQVAAPIVNVEGPRVTVEAPNVTVENNVQPTDVVVQVAAPTVTVEAQMPDVNVTLDMPPRTSTTFIERNPAGDITRTHTVEGAKTPT
ncbi:Protein of unknown function DUF1073 [uncultured Caudovirales phage]|uniref:Anti-CBASS protein Acb1-like N-terminal domain-containing protein n=1 Tax=uncultured Caudovirales phage TaxID=2100421 RepID=A0A6J5NR05_9CAUD|nr:Protein of unknown function DUF1073 [uncultured Caudovirales phage]